jgi:hypothetical protein
LEALVVDVVMGVVEEEYLLATVVVFVGAKCRIEKMNLGYLWFFFFSHYRDCC